MIRLLALATTYHLAGEVLARLAPSMPRGLRAVAGEEYP